MQTDVGLCEQLGLYDTATRLHPEHSKLNWSLFHYFIRCVCAREGERERQGENLIKACVTAWFFYLVATLHLYGGARWVQSTITGTAVRTFSRHAHAIQAQQFINQSCNCLVSVRLSLEVQTATALENKHQLC